MRTVPAHLPRKTRGEISARVRDLLVERQQSDPAEAALYAFIPIFGDLATRLATSVDGSATAKAARDARLAKLGIADDDVDRWYRHCHNYLEAESLRRTGDIGRLILPLLTRAFPDGLGRINDRIKAENLYLHEAVTLLRQPEHAPLLASVGFPMAFLDNLDAALTVSDAALAEVEQARDESSGHVSSGQDAEDAWLDAMVRYRRYIGSRATRRGDKARYEEGLKLLAPLTDELDRLHAERLARETREKNEAKAEAEKKAREAAEKAAAEEAKPKPPAP